MTMKPLGCPFCGGEAAPLDENDYTSCTNITCGSTAYMHVSAWNERPEIENIAKLCEETAMQSASGKSKEKRYSIYTLGHAEMTANNSHPGMGYAALIRERFSSSTPPKPSL